MLHQYLNHILSPKNFHVNQVTVFLLIILNPIINFSYPNYFVLLKFLGPIYYSIIALLQSISINIK